MVVFGLFVLVWLCFAICWRAAYWSVLSSDFFGRWLPAMELFREIAIELPPFLSWLLWPIISCNWICWMVLLLLEY